MRVAYFTAGTIGAGHAVRALAFRRALARSGFTGDIRMFSPPTAYDAINALLTPSEPGHDAAMRVGYFSAGTIGAGHAVHALAFRRALARGGFSGDFKMFAPGTAFNELTGLPHEVVTVRRDELQEPVALRSGLAQALQRYAPDLLLVDLHWAPLRFIIPSLGCPVWLFVRKCPASWFVGLPEVRFDRSQFQRLFSIEPSFRPPVPHEEIDPVVVCNPGECRPRGALRERLGVATNKKLIAVLHAGLPGEWDQLRAQVPDAEIARFDLLTPGALFPAAEWLGDADEIHAGAGYNSFWEAQWLGYADRTTFKPFKRPIDDQAWRIAAGRGYQPRQNGADQVAALIAAG